jgi:GNAT superfamily N-acetyltransferase
MRRPVALDSRSTALGTTRAIRARLPPSGPMRPARRRVEVREARSPSDRLAVGRLFREYFRWLRDHREVTDFDSSILQVGLQRFQSEIDALPGEYGAPDGALFLALADGRPVGCAALRRQAPGVAELKRLYVRALFRGTGAGRKLTLAVLGKAHRLGYQRVVLDTLPKMTAAAALYRRLGFRRTVAYWPHPVADALFFRIDLPISLPARRAGTPVRRGRKRTARTA